MIYYIFKLKNKNMYDHPQRHRKRFWQNPTHIYDKNSPESGHRGNLMIVLPSLQLWLTLWNLIDLSVPGSSVHSVQAREAKDEKVWLGDIIPLSGKEQNLPVPGLQEDSGDSYNYCDSHYQKEITLLCLMFPWGVRSIEHKGWWNWDHSLCCH